MKNCLAGLLVLVVVGSASAAEVHIPVRARAVPGSYIVVLRTDAAAVSRVASPAAVADEMAARHDGAVTFVYEHALRGFAARMSARAAAALAADPRVLYVEQDAEVTASATQEGATWGLDRVDQRSRPLSTTYTYNFDGTGVNAYIIDTGIRKTHQDFGGRALHGFTSVDDGLGSDDCHGHGTHVSGTVGGATWGVAKNVTLWAVRVLNCGGSGTTAGVIAGLNWVTEHHLDPNSPAEPAVANMSLGGGASTALDQAVANSIAAGITFAVAAGNDNRNACSASPARVPEALTAGAATQSDLRSGFSNFGTCVDLFAPGSAITSAWSSSDTATNTINGTSMASPHVAGAAALYLHEHSAATPAEVAAALVAAATPGKLTNIGTGSPNLLLFTLFGDAPPPPPDEPCTDCVHFTGTLPARGSAFEPNGEPYVSAAGTHQGWLRGPEGSDFDLYLQRRSGFFWVTVARSTSSSSEETISYAGNAGTYRWRVRAFSGSGDYDFWLKRP